MNVEHVKNKENVQAHDFSKVAASATMNVEHVINAYVHSPIIIAVPNV